MIRILHDFNNNYDYDIAIYDAAKMSNHVDVNLIEIEKKKRKETFCLICYFFVEEKKIGNSNLYSDMALFKLCLKFVLLFILLKGHL